MQLIVLVTDHVLGPPGEPTPDLSPPSTEDQGPGDEKDEAMEEEEEEGENEESESEGDTSTVRKRVLQLVTIVIIWGLNSTNNLINTLIGYYRSIKINGHSILYNGRRRGRAVRVLDL